MRRSGQYITELVTMDEKQIDVFKRVGPIIDDINNLLKHVETLNQQTGVSEGK